VPKVIKQLILAGANFTRRLNAGGTALGITISNNQTEIVELLVNRIAEIERI
jgi:ankyrin repeat protein